MAKHLASRGSFKGQLLFNTLIKIYEDPPLLPWQRNIGNFDTILGIIRLT